jgi:uncharacterized protein (TIGR02246 family)
LFFIGAGFVLGDHPDTRDCLWRRKLMIVNHRYFQPVLIALMLMSPAAAFADPTEEANAVIDRWSAAYNSNDPEAVVKNYRADAILLGTASPVMSEGSEAIRAYFAPIKGSGNKNTIGERRTLVLSDNAVIITGFYEFIRTKEPGPRPARFTMLLLNYDGEWLIAHHHSSPRNPQP